MIVEAEFFDGQSAKSRMTNVRVMAGTLYVHDLDTGDDFNFKVKDLEITKHNHLIHIEINSGLIVLSETDFKLLKIKKKPFYADLQKVSYLTVVVLTCFMMIYVARKPIIAGILMILPESFLVSSVKALTDEFKKKHCLKPDQEKNMKAIFERLQENQSDYEVYVIPSSLVNAFALPGRVIVIHDELLKKIDSPEALAGILAHEIGHIKHRHNEVGFIKHMMVEGLSGVSASPMVKAYAKSLFTQEEEQEADVVAAKKLRETKISSVGMVKFFSSLEKSDNEMLKYLNVSHPQYANRIQTFTATPYISEPLKLPFKWEIMKKGCGSN